MGDYDSDGSTLVNGTHQRRRSGGSRRYRSPSAEDRERERYYPRQPQSQSYSYDNAYPNGYTYTTEKGDSKSKYATIAKAAVLVGVVGVLVHKWQKEKEKAERRAEREYRHRRRKEFERAKRARRKEEEKREREEAEWEEPGSPPAEVRRIEYAPLEREASRESDEERRRIDAPGARAERGDRAREREYDGPRRSKSRYKD